MQSIIIHQLNKKLFENQTVSTSITSEAININAYSLYAVQHVWTGATGTWSIIIEVSNNGVNFDPVDVTNVTGTSGSRMVNVEKAGYSWVRVRVNYTSGGGTLETTFNSKIL